MVTYTYKNLKKLSCIVIGIFYIFFPFNVLSNSALLDKLYIKDGFKISIFASGLEQPRQIAESANGYFFVGSKKSSNGNIYALKDEDGDNITDSKKLIASGLSSPSGIVYKDGDLYFSEISKIWKIINIDTWLESNTEELPRKQLVIDNLPKDTWHGWKWIGFGPDEMLYVPVGAPCNVCIDPLIKDSRYASINRLNGNKWETVASGVRNTVGFDWHPDSGRLYFSDNGRDWMGDNMPSCELNVVTKDKEFFGFPYVHANDIFDPEFGELAPEDLVYSKPIAELGAHVAPTGTIFYDGKMFPDEYRNNIFITLHGSWNKSEKSGYTIRRIVLDDEGNYLKQEDFVYGWLINNKSIGRPSAPFVASDGSLLVSDDKANVIYRISYEK